MARGKLKRYMELVAYHIHHLEMQSEVVHWRDVTHEMITKYEAFSKKCIADYKLKMNIPDVVYVTQNN